MPIQNTRRQHSVGQGGFHTGEIIVDGSSELSYVYDCGAMRKYAKDRTREISNYIASKGQSKCLDILYISHIHEDHINGIPQLLDNKNGLKVHTIVLPLINNIERLIAFSRSAIESKDSARSRFYREFIIDPVHALARFKPKQIIFVKGSSPDGRAPDFDIIPGEPRGPLPLGRQTSSKEPLWKLVGRGEVQQLSSASMTNGTDVFSIPDSAAILMRGRDASWLLSPYIDPAITSQASKFLGALAAACKVSRRNLASKLNKASQIQKLITTELTALKSAYNALTKDFNVTSLCLYSGPSRFNPPPIKKYYKGNFGLVLVRGCDESRIAWLGTGDADLSTTGRRQSFDNHFGQLLLEVHTMTLPHHGSDHNFHKDLIGSVRAICYVAAADHYSNWKHPGSHAVKSIHSEPALLQVVTSSEATYAYEKALLM